MLVVTGVAASMADECTMTESAPGRRANSRETAGDFDGGEGQALALALWLFST